ncbi:MAG: DUF397 domain-containing protein [Streptomycetaceae bacterium]|nr:DUF397 domain-containing protein [Streptomycetaceae bacterium]
MSQPLDISSTLWEKSSHSNGSGGQCIEFSRTFTPSGIVPVRDSKNPHGPELVFPVGEWSAFVAAVKNGNFLT